MASILVVDDEEGIRSFLADALRSEERSVDTAGTVDEALAAVARQSYQLVITDLRMPGRDGMELVRHLCDEQPDVEVVVMTAHGTVGTAVEAIKLGAFDYLEKPPGSPNEVRSLVGRALERYRLRAAREAARPLQGRRLSYGAPAMEAVVNAVGKVARTSATVLLHGESGTGKEVLARAVHASSPRADGAFIAVNCAALSDQLLESEMFGHEKGAFTGATSRRRGRVELADGGTCFLDEIGELKIGLQAKLLRVLQERQFERVGGTQTVTVDVRWIAATNRDLETMIREGGFREDLFHRLSVFPIDVPPLRERRQDIGPLADMLLAEVATELGRPGMKLEQSAHALLSGQHWRGNVRELRNTLERSAIMVETSTITADDLVFVGSGAPRNTNSALPTIEEAEREAIEQALAHYDGNRKQAAEHLGLGVRTLYDKLKRYGIS